jgi:hypothetical protein
MTVAVLEATASVAITVAAAAAFVLTTTGAARLASSCVPSPTSCAVASVPLGSTSAPVYGFEAAWLRLNW